MEQSPKPADHLANERTFLAWIRTGIAIMAFGFVVVKFALFVKQITFLLSEEHAPIVGHSQGYSAWIGISLVGLGIIISLLAFLRYKSIERQLLRNSFLPTWTLSFLLTATIILTGLLLVVYLASSI